jgi:hypothetical protein
MKIEVEMPDTRGLGDEAFRVIRRGARNAVQEVVMHLVNALKMKVGGSGTGRAYKRTKSGKMHQASAPGQPPARDTGGYVNSFVFGVDERADEVEGQVGSTMWEARGQFLEHGTRTIAPRPHVANTIEENRAAVESRLATAIDRGMTSYSGAA